MSKMTEVETSIAKLVISMSADIKNCSNSYINIKYKKFEFDGRKKFIGHSWRVSPEKNNSGSSVNWYQITNKKTRKLLSILYHDIKFYLQEKERNKEHAVIIKHIEALKLPDDFSERRGLLSHTSKEIT